jgi:RNA polymerase sigma-70 factor (ECF subfamily)
VYRRKNRFPSGNVEDAPELVATNTPDEAVDAERIRARLKHALASLDDERRAVFVLYELEDLTMPEVAEVVGCPLTTAYSRLHSARKALKTAFLRQKLSERSSNT